MQDDALTFAPPVYIDVRENLENKKQPVVMFKRDTGEYWVPNGDMFSDDVAVAHIAPTVSGEYVRVPIMAYETVSASHADILGLGMQLVFRVLHKLRALTANKPKVVHLYLGHECTDLRPGKDSLCCYIGMAIRTR